MKRLLTSLLVICMMFSMFSTVMAEETEVISSTEENIYYSATETSKLDAFEYKDISISSAYNAKMYQDYSKGTITIDSSKGINTTEYDYFMDWVNMPAPWDGIVVAPDHKVIDGATGEERLSVEGTDKLNYSGKDRTIEKTWEHSPIYYKIEEPTSKVKNYITLDENHYFSMKTTEGVEMKYHIDVTSGKALKILGYQSYLISQLDSDYRNELNKHKVATIIVDGYYNKLNFLMLNVVNGVIGNDAKMKYTVNYETGSPDVFDDVVLKQKHHTNSTTESGVFIAGNREQRPHNVQLDVDAGRKITSVKVEVKGVTCDTMLLSMVGETASARNFLEAITDTTVTAENYAKQKGIIAEIENALSKLDIDLAAEDENLYNKYAALKKSLMDFGLDYTEVVNIPIAATGNSKTFSDFDKGETTVDISKGLATTEYNYLTDYMNTITYNTIAVYPDYEGDKVTYGGKQYTAIKTWAHAPLPYSRVKTGGSWANYFPLDENNNWKINLEGTERNWNIDVDTNGKAIVVHKYSEYSISQLSEEDRAKVKSIESAHINVPEGYYDEIHFLMADLTNNGNKYNVYAEVVYTDGSKENRTFRVKNSSVDGYKDYNYSSKGYINAGGSKLFTDNEISVNPVKKVSRINFTTDANVKILMISAQGQSATVRSMINYLPEEITGENYPFMAQAREEINRLIAELNIDLTKETAINSKYNEFLAKMTKAEKDIIINKVSYMKDVITVNVTNFTGKEASFDLVATVYNSDTTEIVEKHIVNKTVPDNSDCVDITESFKVTADGNYILKIMVWDSISTLRPLANVYDAENKVYMFVGDPITHADMYPTLVESYYISRFPANYATFENSGHSGGSANSALKRYDYDIANRNADDAIIMFGMNDVGRDYWPLGPSDEGYAEQMEANQTRIDNCINNITQLVNKLVAADTAVTLMTPSIYDTRDYSTTTNYKGVNSALTEVAEREKTLVSELGLGIINLHDHMNMLNNKVLTSGVEEMIGSDRVHPNSKGAYVIAYNVINHWFPNSGLVANVEIDASNGSFKAENATVKEVNVADGEVSYYYTPKALPWYYGYNYQQVEANGYLNITDELNREIIKVTGLEASTTYTIKFNGEEVTTATGSQLASGVNIATIATNPGQIAGKAVYDNIDAKRKLVVELRDHYRLYTNGNITQLDQTLIDTNNEKIQTFVDSAREAAQPRRYVVTITK